MKLLFVALVSLVMARGCAEEYESGIEEETANEIGYEAEDVKVRKAITVWGAFLKDSHQYIHNAVVKISQASDQLNNPRIRRKGKLRSAIIAADGKLEKLSDLLFRAEKLSKTDIAIDEKALKNIESFIADFKERRAKLDADLVILKNGNYD